MHLGLRLDSLTHPRAPRSLDEALRLARAAGADHVVVTSARGAPDVHPGRRCADAVVDLAESDPEDLLWRAARCGLWISALHLPDLNTRADAALDRNLRRLRTHAAMAVGMGVGVLSVTPAEAPPEATTADKAPDIERLATLLEQVAREYGVPLAVQTCAGSLVSSVEDARCLLTLCRDPRVGVAVDAGELATREQPGWDLLAPPSDRVPLLFWSDNLGHRAGVEPGRGQAPYEPYVQALRRLRWPPASAVSFSVEAAAQLPTATRALAYVRAVWRKSGLV